MKTKQNRRRSFVWGARREDQPRVGDEPDLIKWGEVPDPNDRNGVSCHIERSDRGYWCGYVRLPDGHPWQGVPASGLPKAAHDAAHGGITWAGEGHVGWDANHMQDKNPWTDEHWLGEYRDARYAEDVTRRLARVVMAAMEVSDE